MNKEENLKELYDYFWWISNKFGNKVEIENDIMRHIKRIKYGTPTIKNILTAMNWIDDKIDLSISNVILEKGSNRELYISVIYDSNITNKLSSEYMVYKNNVSFLCLLD